MPDGGLTREPLIAATRAIREFSVTGDLWSAVEEWAERMKYVVIESDTSARVYQAGKGKWNPARRVLIRTTRGIVHLQAWLAKPTSASGMGSGFIPAEITVEPGGFTSSLPRKKARGEVNELLRALGAEPITVALDPNDEMATRFQEGVSEASACTERGEFDEAVGLWDELLPVAERRFGVLHGITLTARIDQAVALLEIGQADRAVTILNQAIPDLDVVLGPDAIWTLNAKESLAVALAVTGNEAAARELGRRVVDDLARTLGADDARTVRAVDAYRRRDWTTGRIPPPPDGGGA